MEDMPLNDVLDESPVEIEETPEVVEPVEPQDTGETKEVETPPVETPEQKRSKGQEAAIIAERRRRQELEHEIQQLRSQVPQAKAQSNEVPQRENFGSDADYYQALGLHAANEHFARLNREREESERQQQQQQTLMQRQKVAEAVVSKGQNQFKDFDAVINNGLAPFLTPDLHEAIFDSDVGHEVAYFLGNNPHEAARIADLPVRQMARELVKLEHRLSSEPKTDPAPPVIPQTLTQTRNAMGRYEPTQNEQTPLDAVLQRKT
jgi:hypothetical protein